MNENSTNKRKPRQKYSPQFKDQVLERIAKEGVPEAMLYSWRAKQKQGGSSLEKQKLQQAEMGLNFKNEFVKFSRKIFSHNIIFMDK